MTSRKALAFGALAVSLPLMFELAASAAAGDIKPQTTFHQDGRATPSQDFVTPEAVEKRRVTRGYGKTPQSKVMQFLRANAKRYGLADDLKDIELVGQQKSLLGTHYRFRQVHDGKEVISGEIVVTTDKSDDVTRISNNIFPSADNKTGNAAPAVDKEKALDAAWKDLGVAQGAKVLDEPLVDLKYLPEKQSFRLVYDVRISVTKPHGYWQYLIDARTGEILQKQNRATDLGNEAEGPVRPSGPTADRGALLKKFREDRGAVHRRNAWTAAHSYLILIR
jgi:zinc metalloprotease ZmpB